MEPDRAEINVQRGGIAKSASEVARDFVLWREVELFEQFRADGDAAGGPDLLQSGIRVMVVI